MLKFFRHKGIAKKILWVIAVLIIISFAFGFSVSQVANTGRMNAVAGKIFGQKISLKTFQSYLLAARDQTMLTYGADYEKVLSYLDLENETWTRILLVKEAEHRGIKVLDREVVAYIHAMPTFQRDGYFDNKLYVSILTHVFRRNPRDFEESIRDQIKMAKVIQSSVGRINIPDAKIREEYIKRNQRLQVGYILIDPKPLITDTDVSTDELQAYYHSNPDKFKTSDTINVQYVQLPLNDKSSLEEHSRAKNTAETIYKTAVANGNLTAAAKANGLTVHETGPFSMDAPSLPTEWSLELLSLAFKAKAGSLLPPSITPAGITIIKILDHQPSSILPYEQAKALVKEQFLLAKATDIAKQKASEAQSVLAKAASSGKDAIMTAARSLGLSPKETPFFAKGDYIPEIGLSEDFQAAAWATNEQKPLSDVILTAKGPVLLWYQALQPIDEKKFEEVRKNFALTLYREESAKAITDVVKEIRARAKLESYLDNIKKETTN